MKIKFKDIVLIYDDVDKIILRFNSELIEIGKTQESFYFFSLLNGQYNEKEIIKICKYKYPNSDILDYMETLKELNVIEYIYENNFDAYSKERWSRNFDFYSSISKFGSNKYSFQEKIFQSKICLIGCGGLGSHILYELSAIGVCNITIVDFDNIELSNLNRQILYKECDIGEKKVYTAKKRILEFNPKMNITAINKKISSKNDFVDVIKNHDLVISVADKPREKIISWLNEACIEENIPYVNGGLNLSRATFYSVIPKVTGCVECWFDCVSHQGQKHILEQDIERSIDYSAPSSSTISFGVCSHWSDGFGGNEHRNRC